MLKHNQDFALLRQSSRYFPSCCNVQDTDKADKVEKALQIEK